MALKQVRGGYLVLILLLLLGACGKKGPVRPLEEKLPQAVAAAELHQRGDSFQLRWQMPLRNQDNSPLTDLSGVEVERLFSNDSEFCAECPGPWPLIARINPDLPAPAQKDGPLYLLRDTGASAGQTARYRLTARNRQGDAGQALVLKQLYRKPLEAPTELRISAHDQSVELRWQPSAVPEGSTLIGYQVYRRSTTSTFPPLPTNPLPLDKPEFSDFGLHNGERYHYRIRSLFDFSGQRLESLPSAEMTATPEAG